MKKRIRKRGLPLTASKGAVSKKNEIEYRKTVMTKKENSDKVIEDTLDDINGYFLTFNGDCIAKRYTVISLLGKGTFASVWKCWDNEASIFVALKLIRNREEYRLSAFKEIEIFETLKKHGGQQKGIVHLIRAFEFREHVVMVFEFLGSNLHQIQSSNEFKPFPLTILKQIGFNLLSAVSFLHDLTIIHTDIKLENILVAFNVAVTYSDILTFGLKLIDFGSAIFDCDLHNRIVTTRCYRAPEVILNKGWSYPCDIWSLGCILYELLSGRLLFNCQNGSDHLALIEDFNSNRKHFEEMSMFNNLLSKMLELNPETRITAREALKHPFFLE